MMNKSNHLILIIITASVLAGGLCINTMPSDATTIQHNNSTHDNDTITITAYPSCVHNCGEYKPYTHTFKNYCPFCHSYGTLQDTPKDPDRNGGYTNNGYGVPEGELTCSNCDADFCGVCGADKDGREIYLIMVR